MFKRIVFIILFLFMFAGTASAAATRPVTVLLDNKKMAFDVQPQIINNRTMVPLKGIFDALQISVNWDQKTKTVTGTKEDTVIKLTIHDSTAYINGKAVQLDTPAVIKNGRTLVPLRFIAEAAESRITWNSTARQAAIYFNTLAPQDGTTAANVINGLNLVERDGYTYEVKYDGIAKYKNGVYMKHILYGNSLYLNMTSQYFFYANPSDKFRIYRIDIDGTHRTVFKGTENATDLTVRDGYIYYIIRGENNGLYRIRTDGTEIKKLISGFVKTMTITDNYIYYFDDYGYSASIYRTDKDGANQVCLYKGYQIDNMLVTNGGIYFSNSDGLAVIDPDGKGYKLITKDICNNLNFKGNKIYYANYSDNNNIYSISTNKNIRSKVNNDESSNLTIIGDDLYYSTRDKNNMPVTKKIKIESPTEDIIPVSANQQGKYLGTAGFNPEFTYPVKDLSGRNRTYSFKFEADDFFRKDAVALGDWVYYFGEYNTKYSGYRHFIYRKRLDGTGGRMIISHWDYKDSGKFVVVGDWIYYLTDQRSFSKVKVDGTQEKALKAIDININPQDYFGNTFVVEGDWIYYQYHSAQLNSTGIYRMKTDGSQAEKLMGLECGDLICIADNTLYANFTGGKVISISLSDKTSRIMGDGWDIPEFNVNSIPEGKIYFSKYDKDTSAKELYSSDLNGSNVTHVLTLPDIPADGNIDMVDHYIYYKDNSNQYRRVPVPGK